MSFKSYAFQALPDGCLLLDDPQPLVFSGRQGLIARYVLARKDEATSPWRLCPGDLHGLALSGLQTRERVIVFEQAEEESLEVLVLEAVHGVSQERTEMLFRFRPLQVVARVPHLRVCPRAVENIYTEELTLEGGAMAPAANWHWRRPHLALGGVVCGR